MNIKEGDWVKFRHHEGWTVEQKVLEKRPDGKLVVGEHDKDPNPTTIKRSDVKGKL